MAEIKPKVTRVSLPPSLHTSHLYSECIIHLAPPQMACDLRLSLLLDRFHFLLSWNVFNHIHFLQCEGHPRHLRIKNGKEHVGLHNRLIIESCHANHKLTVNGALFGQGIDRDL